MRDGYPARRRFRQSAGEFFHCRRDMLMRLNSGAFTYLFVRTWHAFIPVGQRRGFKVPLGSSVLRNHIEAYGGRPVHAPKLALDFLGQPATMTSRQQSGTALL